MMAPQEINAYIEKIAKDNNISRLKAEQAYWKAYVYVENEPQHASFGSEVQQLLLNRKL